MEDFQSNDSHAVPLSTNPFDDLEDDECEEGVLRGEEATPTLSNHAHNDRNPFSDSSSDLELMTEHWEELSDLLESPISNPFALQEFQEHLISFIEIMRSEEGAESDRTSDCVELLLSENILEKLYLFSTKQRNYISDIRQALLVFLKSLLSLSGQPLFIHQQILRPLNRLLRVCETSRDDKLNPAILSLLHQICTLIQDNETFLDLFFTDGGGHVPSKFFIFSHLVSHLHDSGEGGARARDAMLLCLSVAERSVHSSLCDFIVADTDFCHVLATGLSGLYSLLPTSVDLIEDDWVSPLTHLQDTVPELKSFMQALSYCNSVLQMAPLLVCQAVSSMIKNGFLQQVLGPAILQSSPDESAVAIGYLCVFLRNITNASLMKIFLQFILCGVCDGRIVSNALIQFISSENNKLSAITLELFNILINLNCEDVLLSLILQHLLPGNHISSSQWASVKTRDHYCTAARKFLEMIPSCCSKAEELYLESIVKSSPHTSRGSSPPPLAPPTSSLTPTRQESPIDSFIDYRDSPTSQSSTNSSTFVTTTPPSTDVNSTLINAHSAEEAVFEYISPQDSYYNYLMESRAAINDCARACQVWSSCYSDCVGRGDANSDERKNKEGGEKLERDVIEDNVLYVPTVHNGVIASDSVSPSASPRRSRRSYLSYQHDIERFNDEVGLFLKMIIEKVSQLLTNTPLINELLMKLITRLGRYPQPLIRSFLLNHQLIFKPGIPNMMHVLQGLKKNIDTLAKERDTFPSRLGRARKTMIFNSAVATGQVSTEVAAVINVQFRGRSNSQLSDTPTKGNDVKTDDGRLEPVTRRRAMTETSRDSKRKRKKHKVTINMVYSIVMFGEWCKELASLSQEHSTINPELLILRDDC